MPDQELKPFINRTPFRVSTGVIAFLILAAVYLFQRFSLLAVLVNWFGGDYSYIHPYSIFIFNKTSRLVLNDVACFMIIWAVFQEQKYLKVAWYVFLLEVLVVLPVYFAIKLSFEGDSEISSPLLSQIHRMIVNPMLMFLLMAGFFYQRMKINRQAR
jgi:exosortase F-associated protein